VYAYLQKGSDDKALEQLTYLNTINEVFPQNFKVAYAFASIPARYALERRDWATAARLPFQPADLPWDKFPWEKANIHFARLLGAVHINDLKQAARELEQLLSLQKELTAKKEDYKAGLVAIQVKAGEAWLRLREGKKADAVELMIEAADMEDATAKHPVTPGEIIPARELLGDLYLETGDLRNSLDAYKSDLERHPNRFNGLYGAAQALIRLGDKQGAKEYYAQLALVTASSVSNRPQKLLQ
jgi:tetratricopeptide (TPR) repeat protein